MMKTFLVATTVAILGTTGAFAQGFSGGSISIEYSELDELAEYEKTTFDAALEYELTPGFAIAGNLSYYSYVDADDVDLVNFTLHGIYSLNSEVNLGLWVSRDSINSPFDDIEIDNYGLEAAYASGAISIEGYVGAGDANGTDLTYFGIDGDYGFGNGFSVIGRYDSVSFEESGDQTYATAEIGAAYTIASGPSIFATLGNLTFDGPGGSNDDTFYSIGANYSFGGAGGATFGSRGFLEMPFTF